MAELTKSSPSTAPRIGLTSGLSHDSTATFINSIYHECCVDYGVTFTNFCNFLVQSRVMGWTVTHITAMEAFQQAGAPSLTEKLDLKTFREALQFIANIIYGEQHGLGRDGTVRRSSKLMVAQGAARLAALQDMLRDIALNEGGITLRYVSETRNQILAPEVLQAAYEYEQALRGLYSQYVTEIPSSARTSDKDVTTVTGRSAFRLAKACRLIPDCVVGGEFHDVAIALRTQGHRDKYFQDEKMFARGEDVNVLQPARNLLQGEPRYAFPDVVELFIASALHSPPRRYGCSAEECVERIHEVFGQLLKLPTGDGGKDFDAETYLLEACSAIEGDDLKKTQQLSGESPKGIFAIFSLLNAELPALPEKKEPKVAQPSPASLATLKQQPPTKEELIEKARRDFVLKKPAPKGKPKSKKKDVDAPPKKNLFFAQGGWKLNQVAFLAKRPEPPPTEIPLMWRHENMINQFQLLEDNLYKRNEEIKSANVPSSGWVLRMNLIDEPLKAPHCDKSEEVSTLIETALTSRRLRHYDTAISLLIRARHQWATIEAGRTIDAWSDVQPFVATPSPWEIHISEARLSSRSSLADSGHIALIAPVQSPQFGKSATGILPAAVPKSLTSQDDDAEDVPMTAAQRREEFNARTGKSSQNIEPRTARGRSPSSRVATQNRYFERRYDPKNDFALAAGDGEQDLQHLPSEASLFFFCELASLHSALHEDALAAELLYRARHLVDSMAANAAFVWGGLGRVAFHSGLYELAARLHMRARSIREKALGGDTIDTATTYNNLACCLSSLERPNEALAFVELAAEILKVLAGEDHPRTQTALRNLAKAKTAPKHLACEVPCLYSLPVQDHTKMFRSKLKKKKKGSSKSSGGGGGSSKRSKSAGSTGSKSSSKSKKTGQRKK